MSTEAMRKQVAAQYRVVAHLAKAVAEVHSQMERIILEGPTSDEMLNLQGTRSAAFMERLGDMLNAMDAATEDDDWTTPIFREAQTLFPVQERG